jgi:hypothetical protein
LRRHTVSGLPAVRIRFPRTCPSRPHGLPRSAAQSEVGTNPPSRFFPPHRLTPTTCQRPLWITESSTSLLTLAGEISMSSHVRGRPPLLATELNAGDDLLSPWTDYHRPRVLNGRVRDGNGCGHSGLVTGSIGPPVSRRLCTLSTRWAVLHLAARLGTSGGVDGAAKRSAVSIG